MAKPDDTATGARAGTTAPRDSSNESARAGVGDTTNRTLPGAAQQDSTSGMSRMDSMHTDTAGWRDSTKAR
jgi:hypothetical protein